MADRRSVEAALDRIVRRHRFTLAVTVPAVGAVLLLAGSRGLLPAAVVLHPALLLPAVLAMRLPLIAGLSPVLDRRGAIGLGAVGLFAYAVELVGVTTGVPYGSFAYTTDLGPTIAGVVPLALPLLYVPLVVGSYLLGVCLLGRLATSRGVRVLAGVTVLLLVDLVLDPGAVSVDFWAYAAGGVYYGVPLSNFAGWLVSGTLAVAIVDRTVGPSTLRRALDRSAYLLDDLVSSLVLWGGINLAAGHVVPVLVACGLAFGVGRATGAFASVGARSADEEPTG